MTDRETVRDRQWHRQRDGQRQPMTDRGQSETDNDADRETVRDSQ